MKLLNKKIIAFSLVMLLLAGTAVFYAEAASVSKTKSNWVKINTTWVTAKANMLAHHPAGSTQGICTLGSVTNPSTPINVVGFTYFQCDGLEPDGDIWFSLQYPGQAFFNASAYEKVVLKQNAFQGQATNSGHGEPTILTTMVPTPLPGDLVTQSLLNNLFLN